LGFALFNSYYFFEGTVGEPPTYIFVFQLNERIESLYTKRAKRRLQTGRTHPKEKIIKLRKETVSPQG
jgi:hypothetical protein